jgi:hypothetical protein
MDFTQLAGLAGGHAEARAIQVALKLRFFELLKDVDLGAASLAGASGCNPRATMLLANALVAMGLLESKGGLYGLTEASRRMLLENSPEYLGGMILTNLCPRKPPVSSVRWIASYALEAMQPTSRRIWTSALPARSSMSAGAPGLILSSFFVEIRARAAPSTIFQQHLRLRGR